MNQEQQWPPAGAPSGHSAEQKVVSNDVSIISQDDCLEPPETTAAPSSANPFIAASQNVRALIHTPIARPAMLLGDNWPVGELAILHGEPGVGKTWLLLDLLLHMVYGWPWYGLSTAPVDCALLSLEMPAYFLQERVGALNSDCIPSALAYKVQRDGPEHFHIVTADQLGKSVSLTNPSDVNEIIEFCKHFAIQVLCIDPFAKAHIMDENSSHHIGLVMRDLDKIRYETGAAILLVHHERKPMNGTSSEGMNAMRGSTRLAAEARFAMQLRRSRGAMKLLVSKSNIGRIPKPIWLRQGQDGIFEQIEEPPHRDDASNEKRQQILQAILDAGAAGCSTTDIEQQTGIPKRTIQYQIGKLIKNEAISRVGSGPLTKWLAPQPSAESSAQGIAQ